MHDDKQLFLKKQYANIHDESDEEFLLVMPGRRKWHIDKEINLPKRHLGVTIHYQNKTNNSTGKNNKKINFTIERVLA